MYTIYLNIILVVEFVLVYFMYTIYHDRNFTLYYNNKASGMTICLFLSVIYALLGDVLSNDRTLK